MLAATRQALAEERLPALMRWSFASEGTAYWLGYVEGRLAKRLDDTEKARRLLAEGVAPALLRRYDVLAETLPLPDRRREPSAVATLMKALHPGPIFRSQDWMLAEVGGPARGLAQILAGQRWVRSLDAEAKWHEVTVHLGEMLVSLTEELRDRLPHLSGFLGEACHAFGVQVGRGVKWSFDLPDDVESAIEVLRMGEYIFRVNPQHESGKRPDGSGYLEGNACPWFPRPGWGGMHCGIFGRFQDGCASVFGLDYRLKTTIPRHGGDVCRVELRPIPPARLARRRS
ncbi:MAG: hypothetical protein KC731_05410 [Myxococcales bacterium]|nr:hypothetical protein [Myxococcales bacterium]